MDNNQESSNTTSFASILAGVQKLRNLANKIQVEDAQPKPSASSQTSQTNTALKAINNLRNNNESTPDPASKGATSFISAKNRYNELQGSLKRQRDDVAASIAYRNDFEKNNTNNNTITANREQPTSFTKTSLYQQQYQRSQSKSKPAVSKIAIHPSQKGNPLIKSLRNIPYEYTSIVKTDYLINSHISVLFLSLKYHKLRPDYIYGRLKKFGISSIEEDGYSRARSSDSHLKILLLLLDSETNFWDSLQELTKLCVFNGFTLLASWSFEEAGDYIYLLKNIDSTALLKTRGNNDKFDIIKGIHKADYYSRLLETLTSIRSINKTDVSKIASSGEFKNFKELIRDNGEKLELIEGFGSVKLKRFRDTINEPFLYGKDYDADPKVAEWKEKCKKIKLERERAATETLRP